MPNPNPLNNPLINPSNGGFGMHPVERLINLTQISVRRPSFHNGAAQGAPNPSLPAWQIFVNSPARIDD